MEESKKRATCAEQNARLKFARCLLFRFNRRGMNSSNALSGGGDAAHKIVLFGDGFGADGEGVEHTEAEREAQRFVLAVAHIALAENLHADDAFTCGAHLAENTD